MTITNSRELTRWTVCALLVVAAHAGAVALLSRTIPATLPAVPDAIMIDLAPEPDATPSPPPAPPPAPETPPPPAPAPPPPEPPPPETPPVAVPDPPPPVPEPAVALPPPPPPKVPRPPKVIPRPKPAPPPPAAIPADQTPPAAATPPPPAAPPSGEAVATWQGQLAAHLSRFQRYPPEAQQRREQGVVLMRITLDRAGNVLAMTMERTSGYPDLDAEAAAWIKRATPLPPIPPDISGDHANLVIPLRFTLR